MGSTVSEIKRCKIRVTGIVQGVGFRPFIYRLAKENNLTGYVLNDSEGVLIEAQGEKLDEFIRNIRLLAPPASFVSGIATVDLPFKNEETDFVIKPSPQAVERETLISPDLAICADCRREIKDKNDRRYNYAFTNCTNCGPRFPLCGMCRMTAKIQRCRILLCAENAGRNTTVRWIDGFMLSRMRAPIAGRNTVYSARRK